MIFRKKKLKLYSNSDGKEFAIKIDGEREFKAVSDPSAMYTELIDDVKIGSNGIFELSWDQILRRWVSWNNNIYEKDYKFLKRFGILHYIDEDEKVHITTEKNFYKGHSHVPLFDKVIVTDKRIIIFKAHESLFHVNWEPFSVPLDEIQSVELTKRLISVFSCDIIIKTSKLLKINAIKKSIANEIADYVNRYIEEKGTNRQHGNTGP
jgi:hypothetical protein